jgi:cytochrome c553
MNFIRFPKPAAAAAFSLLLLASGALAEDVKKPEPYVPGLGEFMTSAVQPHHIKIWMAGHAGNWPLAGYEAKELRETFEDITTYQGTWNNFPIGKLAETNLVPPLDEMDKAIQDKNQAAFKKAYDKVTAACNSCHQATGNEFVSVKVPSGADFPDQEFQIH